LFFLFFLSYDKTYDKQSFVAPSVTFSTSGRHVSLSHSLGWWRSTVVERRSLTGELSLSCARPAADG